MISRWWLRKRFHLIPNLVDARIPTNEWDQAQAATRDVLDMLITKTVEMIQECPCGQPPGAKNHQLGLWLHIGTRYTGHVPVALLAEAVTRAAAAQIERTQ